MQVENDVNVPLNTRFEREFELKSYGNVSFIELFIVLI